ncbi:hypothetical protein PG997_008020 [Apiospora hydei]|uniref:Lysine-specific metallo-endopeptidase domain-containing protein n=1 Tax=Apiospora hydei TaxID=1337664 RepID=A0ABR1W9V5_9PEZI
MANGFFLLGLITGLLALPPSFIIAEDDGSVNIADIDIKDIFTVQLGSGDGACDDIRMGLLDQWLTEITYSLDTALNSMDKYDGDLRVRRSMFKFFKIANKGILGGEDTLRRKAFNKVRDNIQYIDAFYNNNDEHRKEEYWLFCHSTFLASHEPEDPALDYEANVILNGKGEEIPIREVSTYKKRLDEDEMNVPWWAGDLTNLNGYYFTEHGYDYCDGDALGATAGAGGRAEKAPEVYSIIICPYSFDDNQNQAPNSYKEANDRLVPGKNLADAVPKSATLLHEAFHAIFGGHFLDGDKETYDIGSCTNLAAGNAQTNPENYVFFIAHMYHMFGQKDNNQPWSITTNWDFEVGRENRVLGASSPTPAAPMVPEKL